MPSDKKLRKQAAKLRVIDEAAERLREAVIAGEKRKQEKRMEKVAQLTPERREAMQKAFREEFAGASGYITSERLAEKAKELDVVFTDTQIGDLMNVFDVDGDGKLNEEEFACWWTCGWSSLHQAFRQKELTENINRVAAENTNNLPRWEPTLDYEVDATIGDIPTDFTPKASIMAVATPNDTAQYEAGLKASIAEMADEDDDDENPPKPDAKKTPVFAQLYAGVKEGASEEDVESCLEVLKAVLEEHSEQQDIPVAAKIRLTDNEQGKKCFHLVIYGRTDKVDPEDLESAMEGPTGGLFMFQQMMEHEAAQVDAFDQVCAGIDFGLEPARVLSLGSNTPILALLEKLRFVVQGTVTEHAIQLANFMVCKQFFEEGNDLESKRRVRKLVQKLLPNGAVRGAKISASFASPQQVIEQALSTLYKVPIDLAKDYYPDMTEKQLHALEEETGDMIRAIKAVMQAKAPTDATIKALTASQGLRKFVNTPKNIPKVALVGPKGVNVDEVLRALVDSEVSHVEGAPISVYSAGTEKKRYFVADIGADSHNLIAGFAPTAVVCVVDTASEESTKKGLDTLAWCNRFVEDGTPLFAVATSAPTIPAADERYSQLKAESASTIASKVTAANDSAEGDDGSDDESEDGSEEGGAELIKQILSSVGKALGTLDDIFVSTPSADLHLHLDNFQVNALLPATQDELGLVRAQGKIVFQAIARSAEASMENMEFERIRDILERWEEEMSSSDDDDSDLDDDEEPKPTKPEWPEDYHTKMEEREKSKPKKDAGRKSKKAAQRRGSMSSDISAASSSSSGY